MSSYFTRTDLTLADRRDLELAHNGPIPDRACADLIAARGRVVTITPAPSVSDLQREISYWTTLGKAARVNLRNAENCRAGCIQKYAQASTDAERERHFQAAAKHGERIAEHLRDIAESETMIAEITAQTIAMTAPVSVRLAAE